MTSTALTEAEFDRLQSFLDSLPAGAMNLEELDGFMAGLICSPQLLETSVWLPFVWGREAEQTASFADQQQAQDILGLITRHWNAVTASLRATLEPGGHVHLPLLLQDGAGVAHGNAWARGFMRAMRLSPDGWDGLLNDEEEGGALVPVLMLAHENDEDAELRSPPIAPEQRDELLHYLIAGVMRAYSLFEPQRRAALREAVQGVTFRRSQPKPGRNDPCPCGSGRKFKLCCGRSGAQQH